MSQTSISIVLNYISDAVHYLFIQGKPQPITSFAYIPLIPNSPDAVGLRYIINKRFIGRHNLET